MSPVPCADPATAGRAPAPGALVLPPRLVAAAAAILLLLHWLLAVSASVHWSQTSDELPHLTAGLAYDRFGDFRMHYENGNLPQRVHGLSPLALRATFPMDEARWRRSDYWQLGWDFLYSSGNPTDSMLLAARGLNALFGVAVGLVIFLSARRLLGDAAALVSLGFFVLCPNFLAHSALATSDMAGVLALTAAPLLFWRHLQTRSASSYSLAAAASGLALVSKFNGVLLAPIYAALAVLQAVFESRGQRARLLGRNGLQCLGQAAGAVAVVWAFYEFRFSARAPGAPPLDQFAWSWDDMMSAIGWKAPVLQALLDWRLLPEAWIHGLANVLAGEAGRPAFFAGEYRNDGWASFFPTLFLLKTPVSFLLALLLAGVVVSREARRCSRTCAVAAIKRWTPLVVTAAVFAAVSVNSSLNIGHRHLLPIYPALFVAAGLAAARAGRVGLAFAGVLLVGQSVESFAIRPHYLAHFNLLAGGPERAHRIAVDSSLDWGQALPSLRRWLEENKGADEPVYLSYFGSAWAPHYGVRPRHFLPAVNIARPPEQAYEYGAGLYCISATSLAEVYSPYRGPWRAEWEQAWRDPGLRTDYAKFDLLRFSRLCKFLQRRAPDGHAGHAILIYRLDAREVREVMEGQVKGW